LRLVAAFFGTLAPRRGSKAGSTLRGAIQTFGLERRRPGGFGLGYDRRDGGAPFVAQHNLPFGCYTCYTEMVFSLMDSSLDLQGATIQSFIAASEAIRFGRSAQGRKTRGVLHGRAS